MNTTITLKEVDYEQPEGGAVCSTKHAWARVPAELSQDERAALKDKIRRLLKEKNAVMVSHYYVHPDLQDLAEETGGIVSDSLEMARFGRDHTAQTLVVSGVRFMGETAKILSPEKTVLMPDLDANCSLDLGCPIEEFSAFCDQHPDRTVVVYANTSAAVKARADWLVTSSCALDIVRALKDQGHKISRSIIDFCMEHQCGTLILGVNLLWKQRSNMNKINNQNFVSMPITLLRTMLTYKALNAGIRIIEQEESYTSKADLIANDRIPTYGVDDKDASFSGKRIKRGLYRCSNGMILNADCHAAANIMRKAIPDIWKDTRDYTFLSAPDVYGFHKLNPKGIPVKGIAA